MKKLALIIVVLTLVSSISWAEKFMSVQVREAVVKASPSFTSQNVGTVTYATRLSVTGEEGSWTKISSPAGWIHSSALTKSNIKGAGTKYAGNKVSHDETALAGKGFNPQVEAQFRNENGDLTSAYKEVDRVETFTASDESLSQFARTGELNLR